MLNIHSLLEIQSYLNERLLYYAKKGNQQAIEVIQDINDKLSLEIEQAQEEHSRYMNGLGLGPDTPLMEGRDCLKCKKYIETAVEPTDQEAHFHCPYCDDEFSTEL